MNFRHLGEPLRPLADAVVQYFTREHGVRNFVEEEQIHPELARPTLHAITQDHHFLCVEFSETTPYPPSLDRFVLDCIKHCLPVRIYVAVPTQSTDPNYKRDINRAHSFGVGVAEVNGDHVIVVADPLSLSLAGVRPIDKRNFPIKYRFNLGQAESTFRQGNPAKGCAMIYDEIEALTRRIAEKTKQLGYWSASKKGTARPKLRVTKDPWAKVVRVLMEQLDPGQPPLIPEALLARVLGLTSHRNDSGHKPGTRVALQRRDRELRTRFENATDILLELISAARSLRV